MNVVAAVRNAIRRNGHPSLATLAKQVDYIERQVRLDARTLADANRLP